MWRLTKVKTFLTPYFNYTLVKCSSEKQGLWSVGSNTLIAGETCCWAFACGCAKEEEYSCITDVKALFLFNEKEISISYLKYQKRTRERAHSLSAGRASINTGVWNSSTHVKNQMWQHMLVSPRLERGDRRISALCYSRFKLQVY